MAFSAIAPANTSIRPLGEEHLRMFRRAAGEAEAVPRVTLPKEVLKRPKLEFVGSTQATLEQLKRFAEDRGARLPTIKDLIFAIEDQKQYLALVKELGTTPCWTSDVGIELGEFCRINYTEGKLEEVSGEEWDVLPASQKARVGKGEGTLTFSLGTSTFGPRLVVVSERFESMTSGVVVIARDD